MAEGLSTKQDFVLAALALCPLHSQPPQCFVILKLFFSLLRISFISKIRNENTDSPPCKTARPIGEKGSFGYSLLQNKALMEGRALAAALPMQAVLCSPTGVPVDAPQLTGRQLDHPCPQTAN